MRDHTQHIKELMRLHPDMGRARIGRELEDKVRAKLSVAHVWIIQRIMQEITDERVAVGVPLREQPEREANEDTRRRRVMSPRRKFLGFDTGLKEVTQRPTGLPHLLPSGVHAQASQPVL